MSENPTEGSGKETGSGRKLIAMISPKREDGSDKTDEELAHEIWLAYQGSMRAEQEGTDFEPVLELRPEYQQPE
jgi:hypothetical protein